jgi:hypothetical protein
MDVVIETCIKYSGGPTRMRVTDTHSRYNFVTVSLPVRSRNGRFTSETAVRRFQK